MQGFHIYTFNEVEKTEAWRREVLERSERRPDEQRHKESTA